VNSGLGTVLSRLPDSAGWDYGGFAYGLEPLVLPPTGSPDTVDLLDGPRLTAYAEICTRISGLGALPPEVAPGDEAEQLFWFRWITGHQVCFVVWRLMAGLLDDVRQGRRAADDAVEPMCHYVHGYASMLLYTGSCPRDVYDLLIRPSMRLRHPGFSGSWAPDYWPIRDLVRGRDPALSGAGLLVDALDLHQRVHDGVAAKLVPDGRSLLRQAPVRGLNHRMASMLYDSYFATTRAPIQRHDVVTQLLRRLVAIAQDITANGFSPCDEPDELPVELRATDVVRCAEDLVDVLFGVARQACGLAHAATEVRA